MMQCYKQGRGRLQVHWMNWLDVITKNQLWAAWPLCWAVLAYRKQQQLCCPAGSVGWGAHCLVVGAHVAWAMGSCQEVEAWVQPEGPKETQRKHKEWKSASKFWGGPRASLEISYPQEPGLLCHGDCGSWQSLAKAPDPGNLSSVPAKGMVTCYTATEDKYRRLPEVKPSPEGTAETHFPVQHKWSWNAVGSWYLHIGSSEQRTVADCLLLLLLLLLLSLQSCPTLCDPIDGSPPGSSVPGILQARTLEWVAISFSKAWKWKVKVKSFSGVRL